MPDPQQQQTGTAVDDYVRVKGPDGKSYRFPSGTTKDTAINYFKTKGIGVAQPNKPVAPPPALQGGAASQASPPPTPQPTQPQRDPKQFSYPWQDGKPLKDLHWYGRSGRYFAGEYVGAMDALGGGVVGGAKMLYHLGQALDPTPSTSGRGYEKQKKAVTDLAGDIEGAGKGFVDLAKTSWNLLQHLEAWADPEKVGNTVTNDAMLVDGALKLTHKIISQQIAQGFAPTVGLNPQTALATAHQATNKIPSRFFETAAFQNQWVHAKGLERAKAIGAAEKAVRSEVTTHAQNLDSQIGSTPLNATDIALKIIQDYKDVVKNPAIDKPTRVLQEMVKEAQKVAPGTWTWEQVRQLRSAVGRVLGGPTGPQKAALTKTYVDLTTRLKDVARSRGMIDSWNHYNELERKLSHEHGDLLSSIAEAQSGKQVALELGHDTALTGEMLDNVAKYVPDKIGEPQGSGGKAFKADTLNFIKQAQRIAKESGGWHGTLFRMAYGTPAGVPTMLGIRGAGGSWMQGVVGGALAGAGVAYLIKMARAARLSPDVIEMMLKERGYPSKMPRQTATPPPAGLTAPPGQGFAGGVPPGSPATGGAPHPTQGGAPQLGQGAPPQLPGMAPPQLSAPRHVDVPGGESEMERLRRNPPQPTQEMTEAEKKAAEVKPKGTKAAPGEEITDTFAYQNKFPERVIHSGWTEGNRYRWQMEAAGDILRELTKDKSATSYLNEKLNRIEKFIDAGQGESALGEVPKDKLTELQKAYEKQPAKPGLETTALNLIQSMLKGDWNTARTLVRELKGETSRAYEKGYIDNAVKRVAAGEPGKEPGVRPGTTRESKIGRNTKQAERVAKKREEAMRTKQSEEAEAQARARAKDVSVAHIQIPEAEEALMQLNPTSFRALQKFRKLKNLPDSEYLPALHELLLRAWEQGPGK
jgi:hypothetical protein